MPRLLPRLLKWLEKNPVTQPDYRGPLVLKRRRRRSLWRPLNRTVDAAFSGRRRSLLLDTDNFLTSPEEYVRHKTLPPVLRLHGTQHAVKVDEDRPREMSAQERQWWSSPYLRMLSSPIRRCLVSNRLLPVDFLIRLVALKLPYTGTSLMSTTLVPDGLLHPKFTNRVHGFGHYIACHKDVLEALRGKAHIFSRIAPRLTLHSLLATQIGHQLRLRVLQELEMLSARLKAAPRKSVDDVVIRRLTRSEWTTLKSSGRIPWEGAICVIVVPPVNRDVQTKRRPQPDLGALPSEELNLDARIPGKERPPPPALSALTLKESPTYEEPLDFLEVTHLPHLRVPLYNGISLFPLQTQRAALHEKLCEALNVERSARWKEHKRTDKTLRDEKSSHAFVVFSSAQTVTRADSAPLAVALWRVRMWEGGGWGDCSWLMPKRS
ncbi:hypothetical protein M0805_002453 [Coniferiporia weirii]|nr:hypothetical protein M0805_002453 [Coniferiporia weirii]